MKYLLAIIVLQLSFRLLSQVDNSSLFLNQQQDTIEVNTPYIKLQGMGYLKDIENFGPMKDGYTIFGYQFNPQLGFQISKNVSIEGGVYLRKDFGHKDFNEVLPTFSIRYHKDDFKMIFGNLDGSLNHRLIEPIYAFERVMTNRVENGLQFILNKKKIDFDIWVDWQNMLYRMVNDYERLWGGISLNAFKISNSKFEFKLPFQFTFRHNGGQIARGGTVGGPDREGVYTNLNGSTGIYLKYKFKSKKIRDIYFDTRYIANQNNAHDSTIYKRFGDGMLANIGVNAFGVDVMLSYWYGSDYKSEFGSDLYSSESTSITYAQTYVSYRNLIIVRVTKKISLADQINLTLRVEPQYDIDFGRFNCDFGFYLNFDKRISLKKK